MAAPALQRLLGLNAAEARLLTARAERRLGRRAYRLRAAAFGLAASPASRRLFPRPARERAIRAYLHALLPGPSENLLYAGIRPEVDDDG